MTIMTGTRMPRTATRLTRHLLCAVALITLCGACFQDFLAGPDCSHGECDWFSVSAVNFLLGDTVGVETFTTLENSAATWTMTGSSFAFLGSNGSPQSQQPAALSRVVIKGLSVGSGSLHARSVSGRFEADATVRVADSSVITKITTLYPGVTQVRVGNVHTFTPTLWDAQNVPFIGSPTHWVLSDSSVLSIAPGGLGRGAVTIRGLKPGTTQLTAVFRNITTTAAIQVTP